MSPNTFRMGVKPLFLRRNPLLKGVKPHAFESKLGCVKSGIAARRAWFNGSIPASISGIEFAPASYDFERVVNTNCENVVGTIAMPVGMVGPILMNGHEYHVPFATTEGALVASLNRGVKALNTVGGVRTIVTDQGVTRAPLVECASIDQVVVLDAWLSEHWDKCQTEYATTTKHGSLRSYTLHNILRELALTGGLCPPVL